MSDGLAMLRIATREALEVRRRLGIDRSAPVCVFDLTERLGLEVKFRPEKSLDGMYFNLDPALILVSARRPIGRQAFTCAHELGHHLLGHGTRVDEYVETIGGGRTEDAQERSANHFAATLLMPPTAVRAAFTSRRWTAAEADPVRIYTVATYLGVSYEALVTQMVSTLGLLRRDQGRTLLRHTPQSIRRSLLGDDDCRHLAIVDKAWDGGALAVDLHTGDAVILPAGSEVVGRALEAVREVELGVLAFARRTGVCRAETQDASWSAFIRVARRQDASCTYVGRAAFRHDEDPDEN